MKTKKDQSAIVRTIRALQNQVCDLFKIRSTPIVKNIGLEQVGQEVMASFDHVHFFRTLDSDMKEHTYCSPVAGHFHEVRLEYSEDPNTPPKVLEIGPPLRFVAKKQPNGRVQKVALPIPETHHEYHEHDGADYIDSIKVQRRQMNAEAVQLVAQESAKGVAPPGVV